MDDFAQVFGSHRLPDILFGVFLEHFEKCVVAENVTQHIDYGGALAAGERPEFGRVVVESRGLNERQVVHGEGCDHLVVQLVLHGAGAGGVLGPKQLGIGGHAVGEPEVIAGSGRHQLLPPLARNFVGEQARGHRLGDAVGRQEHHTRRGVAVGGAGLGFDDGEVGVSRQAEGAGEVAHHLANLFAVGLGHGLFGIAEIEGGGDALAIHLDRRVLDYGDAAGKRRPVHLEFEHVLVA